MKKVYLLLRNNYQTGPYTIDELLQQKLKPSDLVWVEGASKAWTYPAELPQLKDYLEGQGATPTSPGPPKQAAVSTGNEIEKWAEELRQKVLSAPKTFIPVPLREDTVHVEVLRAMARERIEFIDHRKRESPAFEWMSGAMVVLIVVAGVYGGARFFKEKTGLPVLADKAVTIDNHAAKAVARPLSQPVLITYQEVKKDTMATDTMALSVLKQQKPVAVPKRRKINIDALPATAIQKVSVPSYTENENASPDTQPLKEDAKKEILIEPETRTIVTQEPAEKKKSGLFKGLFRKKKKVEEKATEPDVKTTGGQ